MQVLFNKSMVHGGQKIIMQVEVDVNACKLFWPEPNFLAVVYHYDHYYELFL